MWCEHYLDKQVTTLSGVSRKSSHTRCRPAASCLRYHRRHNKHLSPNSLSTVPSSINISLNHRLAPSRCLAPNLTSTKPLTDAAVQNRPASASRSRLACRFCSSSETRGVSADQDLSPIRGWSENAFRKNLARSWNRCPLMMSVPKTAELSIRSCCFPASTGVSRLKSCSPSTTTCLFRSSFR